MEKIGDIKLNKEQENIINNFLNKNACFVNASAGTGKTTTITEVYIKLLEAGEKVANIVVITFTKAAANEMLLKIRNRIRKKINEKNSEKKIGEHYSENFDKDYWQKIYKELLLNSKISTINAFAHSIVKEYSMHLGMPPNIYILEEDNEADEILRDGILNVLASSEYGKKVKKIYRIYTEEDKDSFIKSVFNFLIKIKPRLENIEEFEKAALECINIEDKDYNKLYNKIINYSIEIINDNSKQNITVTKCKDKLKNLLECVKKIDIKNLNFVDFENIRENLISVSKAKLGNTKAEELKNLLSELNNYCILMIKYIDAIYNKENYIAVIGFIKETFSEFEKIKKENGIYSHEDIMGKAIESLENETISQEIRENIKALILDEAQDTSKLQFSFINLIVFGKREIKEENIDKQLKEINKKILIVGDRKQSIYRFRNANLKSFKKIQDSFKNYSVDLKNNYRSNSMLIEFFNEFFNETVFLGDNFVNYGEGDNILYDTKNKKTEKKSVSLFVLNKNFEEDEEKKLNIDYRTCIEAYSIANYIKENYKKEEYKETVILLQTFTRLNIYLEALSELKIPYYVDGGNGFYRREEIENIILFLRYLILKDYSILPKLLRMEFFDIDIGNLSDFSNSLLSEGLDLKDYFSLSALYYEKYNKAFEIAKEKNYFKELEKNKELLNHIEKKSAIINSSDIIETICISTNYYNYLMTKEDAELCYANIEKLKSIANDFEDKSGKSSYDFIINLNSTINDISYASIPKLSVEAVKVMTIHKSKGLEFKNVFLAGVGYSRNVSTDIFDFIEDYPIIEIPVHNYIKDYKIKLSKEEGDYNKNAELSEKRRLLYVALTRAKENLILSGENAKNKTNTYRWYIDNYLDELKTVNNEMPSESQNKLIEIKNINNNFVNFYSYGIGIIPENKKNVKKEDINQINKKLESLQENVNRIKKNKETKKNIENEIISIQYIIPSKIGVDLAENNFKNITELLNKRLPNLELEKEEIDDYEEKIQISPASMGTIMHELLEWFNFDKYSIDKKHYIEKLKSETLKYYNYYNREDLKERLNKYFNNFIENEHIKNIINGKEKIISREHKFQSVKLENKILSIIVAKIDLITQTLDGKYFILDYKTSKRSKEKSAFYQNQLNVYKEIVKEVFKIESENNLETDIIFLG